MKGLLIKDFRLLKNQRISLLVIAVVAVGMSAYLEDSSFIITYISLVGTIFATGTLSYDELDNGYSFLFTLPVTRRVYVAEKYVLGLVCGMGAWLLGLLVSVGAELTMHSGSVTDTVMASLLIQPVVPMLLAVTIPFRLKYGGEKGRLVMVLAMGITIGGGALLGKLVQSLDVDPGAALKGLFTLGAGATVGGAFAVSAVLLLLSCRISMGIMDKKEF